MHWSGCCLVVCIMISTPVRVVTQQHCWQALTAASYKQCMYGKDQGYATTWFSQYSDSGKEEQAAIWEYWRYYEIVSSPGSYKTHVRLEECETDNDLKDYKDFSTYLLVAKSPTQEAGLGERDYWMGNRNPWDAQVEIVGGESMDDAEIAALKHPSSWVNWAKCLRNTPSLTPFSQKYSNWAFSTWYDGSPMFCPPKGKTMHCKITVDICSSGSYGTGDCACLNTLKDNWGRVGDKVCIKSGEAVNQVQMYSSQSTGVGGLLGPTSPQNWETPPFAARRVVYKKDAVIYLPISANRTVPSGKYALGQITYAMVDPVIFPGVHKPVMSPGVTFPCPAGTWMTCRDAPIAGDLRDGICIYPVATYGEIAEQWKIDITAFNAETKQSNSISKLVSFPKSGPFEDTVPGVGDATCYPCRTAGGRTHYGNYFGKPSNQNLAENVLEYYCPGGHKSPESCSLNRVTPFDPKTGITTLATCVCGNGYWRDSGGDCQTCPAGSYCNVLSVTGDSAAQDPRPIPCPDGFYSGAMAKECTECSTDVNQCTQNQRLTKCRLNKDTTQTLSVRTKWQTADAKCVSCNDCEAFGRQGGKPCHGYTPLGSAT